jgi:hypothetical protein
MTIALVLKINLKSYENQNFLVAKAILSERPMT